MLVEIKKGPNVLIAVKAVKDVLHVGLKDARDMVYASRFECPDDMYDELKDFLEGTGATLIKIS